MRKSVYALVVAGALFPAPVLAQSALSINHYVTDDMPHDQCMDRARRVIREAGLSSLPKTSEAMWGETSDRRVLASIYCLKTRDVAVIAVAGRRLDDTRPILQRLMKTWGDQ
jgi:hypothetical protein